MGNLCIKGDENHATSEPVKARFSQRLLNTAGSNVVAEQVQAQFKAKRNRANVFTKGANLSSPPQHKTYPKTDAQKRILRDALMENFLFSGITEEGIDLLTEATRMASVKANDVVINQGDEGNYFYIVEEGNFEVSVDGKRQAMPIGASGCFGELALLYDQPRAATVRATKQSSVFILERETFRYIIANASEAKTARAREMLQKVSILDGLSDAQLDDLAACVETRSFAANSIIFQKGADGDIFYMVNSGSVSLTELGGNFTDVTISDGGNFGERALLTGEPRSGTARTSTTCRLMMLDRATFEQKLGPIKELLARNLAMVALTSTKLFANLSDQERSLLTKRFQQRKIKAGTNLITKGEHGDRFYVIYEGKATVLDENGKSLKELRNGDYTGETALKNESDIRTATVRADTDLEVYSLDRACYNQIKDRINNELEREAKHRMSVRTDDDQALIDKLKITDLKRVAVLGSGTFGRVTLEKIQANGKMRYFALKAMLKAELVQQKQQLNVMNEKNIMIDAHHPFILRLYRTFKDAKRLYMLLEFVQGGELFTVVHTPSQDGVPMDQAKFYAAGVLLGMAYLHSKDIAYRDMKPENCLVDSQGYPKIVDFGFSKVIKKKSYTLCGTPEYLAPELVLGRGHNKAVDLWAFGILVYELAVGNSPFHDPRNMDQTTICRNIVNGKLIFPKDGFGRKGAFDPNCKDIVSKLLVRQPDMRLGNRMGGSDEIFNHPWFKSINFDVYMEKGIRAPWVPPLKNPGDTSHFEGIDDHVGDGPPYTDKTGWENDF